MNIIIALLALSFLIIVHELGHFTVAKLAGIRVLEFGLFMGPKLFKVQKGETVYSIGAIPLGGFVRMEGEEEASTDDRAYNKKPILSRAAVIAAGPIMNLITALIILTIVLSVVGYYTTTVNEIVPNSPGAVAGLEKGDKIVKYGDKNIYHPGEVSLFMFGTKGKPVTIKVIRQGKEKEIPIAPDVIAANRYIFGFTTGTAYGKESLLVKSITKGSPAEKAHMKVGDMIYRVDEKLIKDKQEFRNYLDKTKNKPVTVWVMRNGQEIKLDAVTPVMDKGTEQYDIGIGYTNEKGNFVETIKNATTYGSFMAKNVYYSLAWLITGRVTFKEMSGPVGIVSSIGDVVKLSPTFQDKIINLLNFVALISINLGLFNLIPFPALDGSKLIILAVEGIRRKPLAPEKEAYITMVGFVILIMLMIFTTYNDILRLIGVK